MIDYYKRWAWEHRCFSKDYRLDHGNPYLNKDVKICCNCSTPNIKNLPKFKTFLKNMMYEQRKMQKSKLMYVRAENIIPYSIFLSV